MDDPVVAIVAGKSISIGLIVSFIAQYLKGKDVFSFLPEGFRRYGIRLIIVAVCVGVNALATVSQGGVPDVSMLFQAALSYAVSSAAYDHLFRA